MPKILKSAYFKAKNGFFLRIFAKTRSPFSNSYEFLIQKITKFYKNLRIRKKNLQINKSNPVIFANEKKRKSSSDGSRLLEHQTCPLKSFTVSASLISEGRSF